MKHSGILSAAITLLEDILTLPHPADQVVRHYLRDRRYIGAKDRKKISEYVFQILRFKRSLSWRIQEADAAVGEHLHATPRMLMVAFLATHESLEAAEITELFSNEPYGPGALKPDERDYLQALTQQTSVVFSPSTPRAVRWDIPDWALPRLEKIFGETLEIALAALLEHAPLDVRINAALSDNQQAEAFFQEHQTPFQRLLETSHGYRLPRGAAISQTSYFLSGGLEVQDLGSQMIVDACAPAAGMHVLDYCAGAGGKTLALSAAMGDSGFLMACDTSARRLKECQLRMKRAQADGIKVHLIDPHDALWEQQQARSFDRVLVDAPCTGSGTWRRNPGLKWRSLPSDIDPACQTQREILEKAAPLVKKGGWLIYATCSLWEEENEQQADWFLAQHPAFALIKSARLAPHTTHTDGFYYAIFERAQ